MMCVAYFLSFTTTIRIIKYQYNYDKTLVQSIDISMVKHLLIGWEFKSHPKQKLFPSGKSSGNSSCLGLNKRDIPLITIA